MKTVLLVTNVGRDDTGGRAAHFETRVCELRRRGWSVERCHVPTPRATLAGIARGVRLARRADAAVINSVSNPFHLHLVGMAVARASGRPWLAEFRDPLVPNPDRGRGFTSALARVVERLTVTHADRLAWIDGIQVDLGAYFADAYPAVDPGRVEKLPFMGYDADAFERAAARERDGFTITYAGSFYDGWIEPDAFLEGLASHQRAMGPGVRAEFFGDWAAEYDRLVLSLGIADAVTAHGFVEHETVVPELLGADALLYVGGTDPRNRKSVPSKLWDYVAAGVPILAVVDPSFRIARLVDEHDLGVVAHPSDTDGIADAIQRLREGAVGYDPDSDLHGVTRGQFLDAFAGVLDGVARDRHPDSPAGAEVLHT